eukprot:gene9553-11234_t
MSNQYAIRSQNPDCIRYVLENKDSILPAPAESSLYFPRRLNFNPAQAADINMINEIVQPKWLDYAHQNGCPVDQRVCMAAIKVNCAVPMLWYMGTNKFPFDSNLCRQAAKQGSENLLRFLHLHACPWTVATTRDAAAGGNIEILKFAAEEGCPVAPVTCSYGQDCDEEGSHFECMKYVFDNHDSSFDSISAVTRDHFACFCYAHNNGAPWREEIVVTAARLGKLDYLTYAFEEGGCPFYPYYQRVYDAVVENAHDEECIEYLDELYEEKTLEIVFSTLSATIDACGRPPLSEQYQSGEFQT